MIAVFEENDRQELLAGNKVESTIFRIFPIFFPLVPSFLFNNF